MANSNFIPFGNDRGFPSIPSRSAAPSCEEYLGSTARKRMLGRCVTLRVCACVRVYACARICTYVQRVRIYNIYIHITILYIRAITSRAFAFSSLFLPVPGAPSLARLTMPFRHRPRPSNPTHDTVCPRSDATRPARRVRIATTR